MNVKVTDKTSNSITVVLDEVDASVANAIRRTILSEVPTLAVEYVDFIENTSSFYDEVIAHRFGLVPIKTDLKALNFREECSCKNGCANCTVNFSLSKKGPCVVYSHDVKSDDSKMKMVDDIPLLRLGTGQKISLEAVAVLGTGKRHAKWQPAVVSYKYYPEITINSSCNLCGDCVEACPRKILSISQKKLKVTDEEKCSLCNTCVEACDVNGIKVEGNKKRFILRVESNGALKPGEILDKSCEILQDKAKELKSLL